MDICLSHLEVTSIPRTVALLGDCLLHGVGLATIIAACRSLSRVVESFAEHLSPGKVYEQSTTRCFLRMSSLVTAPRSGVSEAVIRAVGDSIGQLAKVDIF